MTMRRGRRQRPTIRRSFGGGTGSATALNTVILDFVAATEVAAGADSQTGSLLVTGVMTSTIKNALHRVKIWKGRTTTEPADSDAGVRTRDLPANPDGIPFIFRIKGLTLHQGDLMKLYSDAIFEEDASSVHTSIVSTKWAYHEMR